MKNTVGEVPARLTVGRIDPQAETEAYRAEVLASAGAGLDAQGRALLEEDLRSPCTEEIAVFRAFARAVDQGQDGFVVLDTAPTGHTILLLDATLAYHRELSRQSSGIPDSVQQLLPRLRDPDFTRVLLITLPEATPVHEAAQLQEDLVRAGIRPFAWVINQSLAPLPVTDPVLLARQHHEAGVHPRSRSAVGIPHGDHPLADRNAGGCRISRRGCSRREGRESRSEGSFVRGNRRLSKSFGVSRVRHALGRVETKGGVSLGTFRR